MNILHRLKSIGAITLPEYVISSQEETEVFLTERQWRDELFKTDELFKIPLSYSASEKEAAAVIIDAIKKIVRDELKRAFSKAQQGNWIRPPDEL